MNLESLRTLREEAVSEASGASSPGDVERVRVKYLGRKGWLPRIMKELKDVDPSERAAVGQAANAFREELAVLLEARQKAGETGASAEAPLLDPTAPGQWRGLGAKHPISLVIEDAIRIFGRVGFTVAEGPDVERKHRNFDALNTPEHHPSLDERDTLWLETGELLRTQTSPVQIRVMESRKPPVRIITPGRCYRRDTVDATHSANFHQIEGLYVDRDVSLADLKGVLGYFVREMMGAQTRVRFRPHFFPFTEPSVECDFSCHMCGGRGCGVCKHSGWIEIAGAGMVDPRVFEKVGYDPETTTGYAFGMGVERIVMVKYGIQDIRMLYDNDARFLAQFA